jgi:hypothetical protein
MKAHVFARPPKLREVAPHLEALLRNRQFLAAYREARERWSAGELIAFPVGNYWLRRFSHVPLAA